MDKAPIQIGMHVRCIDGECGTIRQILIDPETRRAFNAIVELSSSEKTIIMPITYLREINKDSAQVNHDRRDLQSLKNYDDQTQEEINTLGTVEVFEGMDVVAVDGRVGDVRRILLDPSTMKVHFFIVDTGILVGHYVIMPSYFVTKMENHTIYIDRDKETIRKLPKFDKGSPLGG